MAKRGDYTYDQLNRLTQKTYPDTTTVNYTYDNDSRLTAVTDPTGTYSFRFDNFFAGYKYSPHPMGRLTNTTTQYSFLTGRNFTSSYSYDAASNRTGFTDPEGGSSSYAYDTLNRLQTLTPPSAFTSGSFGFSYDALSRRTQMTRPNGITTNYTYDSLSRLLSVLHQSGNTTLDGAIYTVDNAGNRTSKADQYAGVTSNFTYDPIYELTQVMQGTNTTESYSYDAVGNRLSSLGVSPYSVNASNELTSTPSTTYAYDDDGNTTSKTDSTGTTSYSWDYENRLTSVTLPGSGGTVSFKYDPFGRRIEKISPTTTSIFAYDGDNLVETVNGTGGVVARYTDGWNIDEPLAESRSGTVSYYEQDGVASVTSLTNAAGALTQSYTYDSFGNTTNSSGSVTNFLRYAGRDFDTETGLYFDRARYFDPASGRFLSEDPKQFAADVNFYRYVWNNPVDFSDPLGLQGNANTWTYGEIGSWAWLPLPGHPPPPGLGDAKASIGAACALNGGGCNSVDGSGATDHISQAAWNNIQNANGTDKSGGGNFMCVGSQGCWFVHRCYKCLNGNKTLVDRPQPLEPSGTVNVGRHTIYFYNDPLKGWCDEADSKSGCHCGGK